MDVRSILVGKCYVTPEGERRQVTALNNGQVSYSSLSGTHGPGILARVPDKHMALDKFAAEAEYAVD